MHHGASRAAEGALFNSVVLAEGLPYNESQTWIKHGLKQTNMAPSQHESHNMLLVDF
jgi:hypothetical protein